MAEIPLSDGDRQSSPRPALLTPSGLVEFPAEWREAYGSGDIPPHTPETVHLDMQNGWTPPRLNGVARFSLEHARFLWRLGEEERPVTLSPEQVTMLAAAFEAIGAELGDGVGGLPDPEPEVPEVGTASPPQPQAGVGGAFSPLAGEGIPF